MPGKIKLEDIEIIKKGNDFEVKWGEKTLKAKCFYHDNRKPFPTDAGKFKRGLEEGIILFAKKGLVIKGSDISECKANPKNGECCYAVFQGKAYADYFIRTFGGLSSIPFEWQ